MPSLPSELKAWLDFNRQVFQNVFQEFVDHKVVTIDRNVPFACNDCGRCCYTQDLGTFVYPNDIDRMINTGTFLPLCCIFPQEDEDGNISYAIPSKREWHDEMNRLLDDFPDDPDVVRAYKEIDCMLAELNPDMSVEDDSCIFYANSKPNLRCTIYEVRPTGCRVYPFDRFKISRLQMPPDLAQKYSLLGNEPTTDPYLYCDPACFTRLCNLKFKRMREDIVADKVNAILSTEIIPDFADIDFSLELFRTFYPRVLESNKD